MGSRTLPLGPRCNTFEATASTHNYDTSLKSVPLISTATKIKMQNKTTTFGLILEGP